METSVPIESFYANRTDRELYRIQPFLAKLADAKVKDVRPLIRNKYNIEQLLRNLDVVFPVNDRQRNTTYTYTER